MNVLSLFDGMSCGRIALERAGIKVNQYYASEIDKYAIKVSKANYPDIIHIGDVKQVSWFGLPKIDLLIGGSPCQGFSNAGLGHNFNDPRSKLFFEFVRILLETKPKYFLLENVKMKKEWQNIITSYLGIEPIKINSTLVSAQNRERLYWTNIPNIIQPEDKGILLKNIIEDGEDGEVDRSKSLTLLSTYQGATKGGYDKKLHQIVIMQTPRGNNPGGIRALDGRVPSMTANSYHENNKLVRIGNTNPSGKGMNGHIYDIYGKYSTLTTNKGEGGKIGCIEVGKWDTAINTFDVNKRIYSIEGKSPTLTGAGGDYHERKIAIDNILWRKLTPVECERLQTVPDNYANHVSNSPRYKMLGNGWTVDIIAHIIRGVIK